MRHLAEPTPIFDRVMADQGIDMMPLPPHLTHAAFMAMNGFDEWLRGQEEILRSDICNVLRRNNRERA